MALFGSAGAAFCTQLGSIFSFGRLIPVRRPLRSKGLSVLACITPLRVRGLGLGLGARARGFIDRLARKEPWMICPCGSPEVLRPLGRGGDDLPTMQGRKRTQGSPERRTTLTPMLSINPWLSFARNRIGGRMHLKPTKPLSLTIGGTKTVFCPHQTVRVPAAVGKRLLGQAPDRVKRVKR